MTFEGETVFRIICAAALVGVGAARDYFTFIRPYLRSEPRRTATEVIDDLAMAVFVNNWDRGLGLPMLIAAACFFAGLGAYIVNPDLMAWSAVRLPGTIRWAGAALGLLGALGEMWTFTNLGRQYSPLLRVRKDQLLVTSGPYAYVRHPLYTFGFPFMFGLALVAANWFVLLSAGVALTLLVTVRVPREEAMLTEAFGDAYRDYAKRTGRLLPRWRGR